MKIYSRNKPFGLTFLGAKNEGIPEGKLMSAPEVYNPSGLTLMIDDFSVIDESEWYSIGFKLVQEIEAIAKKKGAA